MWTAHNSVSQINLYLHSNNFVWPAKKSETKILLKHFVGFLIVQHSHQRLPKNCRILSQNSLLLIVCRAANIKYFKEFSLTSSDASSVIHNRTSMICRIHLKTERKKENSWNVFHFSEKATQFCWESVCCSASEHPRLLWVLKHWSLFTLVFSRTWTFYRDFA